MSDLDFGSIDLASLYETASDPQFTHGRDLIDLLAIRRGERVLDVGCGTGRLAAVVADLVGPDGRIVGIDPAPARIELAQLRGGARLEFRIGRAEDLSAFGGANFDVVFQNSVLNWLEDKSRAMAEAYRVLRRGGRFGIATTFSDRPNELRHLIRRAQDMAFGGEAGASGPSPAARSTEEYANRGITLEAIRGLLQAAGLETRIFQSRTYSSSFEDAVQIIEFRRATNFGQVIPEMTMTPMHVEKLRSALDCVIAEEIPASRRANGIQLERYVLLAVADKPA